VLVVGAGFSGAVLAVRLLRLSHARVTLIERTGAFGRGVAYSTTSEVHRLNVRSCRMSAFPEDPGHFVRWLEEHAPSEAEADGFARRSLYGAYLGDVLRETAARAPGRLVRRFGEVANLEPAPDGVSAFLSDGTIVEGEAAVLALGAPPPATPAPVRGLLGSSRYIADPWAPHALDLIGRSDDIVLMGTGLTAVDVLLALEARGWTGEATAVSRHGFLPEAHAGAAGAPAAAPPRIRTLSQALADFRRRAETTPWPHLMDELRPHLPALWLRLGPEERRRFLRHLRPWWDVRRHRLAPDVAARLAGLKAQGRLRIAPARITGASRRGDRLLVEVRPRGGEEGRTVSGAWLINCTGPAEVSQSGDPLIASLLACGTARPDPLGLGLDVDADLRLKSARGERHERLFAIGPLTRGVFWESTAVPELATHACDLARRLDGLAASWQSGGEPWRTSAESHVLRAAGYAAR
jgi:uncharacterized NAD(P)/FAD-binding protein YdhS